MKKPYWIIALVLLAGSAFLVLNDAGQEVQLEQPAVTAVEPAAQPVDVAPPQPDMSAAAVEARLLPHNQLTTTRSALSYTNTQLQTMRTERQQLETEIQNLMAEYNENLHDPARRAELEQQIMGYHSEYKALMLKLGKAELQLQAANN